MATQLIVLYLRMSKNIDDYIPNFMCHDRPTGMHSAKALAIAKATLLPHDETKVSVSEEICYEHEKLLLELNAGKQSSWKRLLHISRGLEHTRAALSDSGEVVIRELASPKGMEAGDFSAKADSAIVNGRRLYWNNFFVSALTDLCLSMETMTWNRADAPICFFSRDGSRLIKASFSLNDLRTFREVFKWSCGLLSDAEKNSGPFMKDSWDELVGDTSVNIMEAIGIKRLRLRWSEEFKKTLSEASGMSIMTIWHVLMERVKPLLGSYEVSEDVLEDEILREAQLISSMSKKK